MNCQYAEALKERKDAEKRRRDRKRKDKEAREKENREWAREGKSPIPSPDSMPKRDSSPSGLGNVDYSMLPDPDTEVAGGQSPDQQQAGDEPPASPVGNRAPVQTMGKRTPAQADAETLRRASPPRPRVAPSAPPVGNSAGTSGSARAPKSGLRKRKLDAASG